MSHSQYSPSQLSRILNCPGSVALSQQVAVPSSNSYALEGTYCHAISEKLLGAMIANEPMPDVTYETDEQESAIQDAVHYVYNMVKDSSVSLEMVVSMPGDLSDVYGTADVCTIDAHTVRIIDYKFGKTEVAAEENVQLLAYLSGWLEHLRMLGNTDEELATREWLVTIVQPRINNYVEWTVTPEVLKDFESRVELMLSVTKGQHENPLLFPGEVQCRYCAAAAICPARIKELTEAIDAAEEESKDLSRANEQRLLELSSLLMRRDNAMRAFTQIEEYLLGRAIGGAAIPSHKLVRGTKYRQWNVGVDVGQLLNMFPSLEAKEDKLLTVKLATPAQVEKLLPKDERPDLSSLFNRPQGELKLVHESSKKASVSKTCNLVQFKD